MQVFKIHIKKSHPDYREAVRQMEISKRYYNKLNFLARQTYFHHTKKPYKLTGDQTLDNWILGDNYNGSAVGFEPLRKPLTQKIRINSKVAQGIGRNLAGNWQSYFGHRKAGLSAEIPKYNRHKYHVVPYNLQAISKRALNNGIIKPAGFKKGLMLPKSCNPDSVQACSLVCKNGKIWLIVAYNEAMVEKVKRGKVLAAIDLGVNDIVAMAFSDKSSPIVISDKHIKSWNQNWNKIVAKRKNGQQYYWSNRLDAVTSTRNLRMEQFINRAGNVIVNKLIEHNVGRLIIGKNEGWKQNVNLGKKNNQNFVQIPFARLANNIAYKAESVGIRVVFQEESYTSQASFISQDPIPIYSEKDKTKHVFSGKRRPRGKYTDGDTVIHADINAAFNIMRKNKKNNAIKIWGEKKNIQPLGIKLYA